MENKATQMTQKEATLNEQMSARVYKQLFTDAEWDAIASAMGDYSDYGDEEASVANMIQTKIARIYELTANWFFILINIMFMHRLPNGKLTMHEGLPRELAIKRMEDHERWVQEHREELEVSSQQLFDDMFGGWMNTTTATYQIQVTTDEGSLSFLKDMPTRPKTKKGIKSQNNKLSKWVEKQYPNYIEYEIALIEC